MECNAMGMNQACSNTWEIVGNWKINRYALLIIKCMFLSTKTWLLLNEVYGCCIHALHIMEKKRCILGPSVPFIHKCLSKKRHIMLPKW